MAYAATVYKVMIASPCDVDSERGIIREVIHEWNYVNSEDKGLVLMPIGWETHSAPSMEDRAQAVINKHILEDCDLLVAVFWTRLGTPTGDAPSGTVEEIRKHLGAGKPAMIYFSNAPVRLDSVDDIQYEALQEFKAECQEKGLIEVYESLAEFREKFSRHLSITVLKEYTSQSSGTEEVSSALEHIDLGGSAIPSLSDEAKRLLLEAAKDRNGTILKIRTMSGLTIQTNGINFVEQDNPRSEAVWEEAIDQLQIEKLIAGRGYKGEVFQLTAGGYEVADYLSDVVLTA